MTPALQLMTKYLIAQHNLTDDECKNIVEILGRKLNLAWRRMFS